MSWFGGGKKSDKARKKQIASLEAKDGKSYKLYKMARNHFRVTFRCRGFSDALAIQIHLSEDFPDSPPKISVDRKYSHHLLDDNGVVANLDELNKWTPHSDLGNIVQKITNIFNTSQPTIKQNFPSQAQAPVQRSSQILPGPQSQQMVQSRSQDWQMQGNGGGPPPYDKHMNQIGRSQSHQPQGYGNQPPMQQYPNQYPPYGGHSGGPAMGGYNNSYNNNYNNNNNNNYNPNGYPNYNPNNNNNNNNNSYGNDNNNNNRRSSQHNKNEASDLLLTMKLSPPSVIPGLAQKTLSELQELDREPQLIKDYAYSIGSTLREMKREAQNGCMETAQKNIAAYDEIRKLTKQNDEVRSNVETLTELYKNLKKREEKVLQKFSIPRIMAQIDTELDKIDEQCAALKDQFETAEITHVIFIKKFTKLRSAYHTLEIKKEKLQVRHGHFQ